MVGVTNTIIVTSDADSVLEQAESLEQWLSQRVLSHRHITAENPVEMVILQEFQRVMIISPTREVSQEIKQALENGVTPFSLHYSYSMADTSDQSPEYLTVPKSKRVFLISPPTSPPPEFDYARCEQPPPRARTHEQRHTDDSQFLTLLDSKIASIALQRCDPEQSSETTTSRQNRTALPPRTHRPPGDRQQGDPAA